MRTHRGMKSWVPQHTQRVLHERMCVTNITEQARCAIIHRIHRAAAARGNHRASQRLRLDQGIRRALFARGMQQHIGGRHQCANIITHAKHSESSLRRVAHRCGKLLTQRTVSRLEDDDVFLCAQQLHRGLGPHQWLLFLGKTKHAEHDSCVVNTEGGPRAVGRALGAGRHRARIDAVEHDVKARRIDADPSRVIFSACARIGNEGDARRSSKRSIPLKASWYLQARKVSWIHIARRQHDALDSSRERRIARERIGVIRNGFDTTQFTAPLDIDVANARAALGAIGRPLVLGIFRLSDEKQPHQFVHVARRVLKRLPNCVFAIVGDGPMLAEIHRSTVDLGDSFVTLGRRSDVPALIACADAMLLCSRVEGLPNVLIEAQAFGCPVVASDAGGTKETMIPDETGFLCPVGDVAGLSDAILRLLIDSELRARMSARAKSFARERFPIERMVRETHRLYGMHDGGL